jgi:hypothetical protein
VFGVLRVLAELVALVGGLILLLVGWLWGFPGPEFGYASWLQVPGRILFVAAIPIAGFAIASVNMLERDSLRADDSTRSSRVRTLIPWLGVLAWLVVAAGYASVAFDVWAPGRPLHFPRASLGMPMLVVTVFCISAAVVVFRNARTEK